MSQYRIPAESNKYYLPKHTFLACIHYALQYRDWKATLDADRDTRGAIRYDKDRVQTSNDFDSTSATAIRMVEIQEKVDMIEDVIKIACINDEGMQKYLRLSVCYGFTIYQLQEQGVPCGKNYMSKLRQRFYWELSRRI